jgi:hypothetical protein
VKILVITALELLLLHSCLAQGKPVPRGLHEAEQASEQSEKNVPPPQIISHSNPGQRQKDADELARLAESLPAEVAQVNRGILPKDLSDKLKKIEKLSKRLRGEIAQ